MIKYTILNIILLNKYDIDDYNIRVNLKEEFLETDEYLKKQFTTNYSKFVKHYRFKKDIHMKWIILILILQL